MDPMKLQLCLTFIRNILTARMDEIQHNPERDAMLALAIFALLDATNSVPNNVSIS